MDIIINGHHLKTGSRRQCSTSTGLPRCSGFFGKQLQHCKKNVESPSIFHRMIPNSKSCFQDVSGLTKKVGLGDNQRWNHWFKTVKLLPPGVGGRIQSSGTSQWWWGWFVSTLLVTKFFWKVPHVPKSLFEHNFNFLVWRRLFKGRNNYCVFILFGDGWGSSIEGKIISTRLWKLFWTFCLKPNHLQNKFNYFQVDRLDKFGWFVMEIIFRDLQVVRGPQNNVNHICLKLGG